jgi:hypothetical protein
MSANVRLRPVARPDHREITGPHADCGQTKGRVPHLVAQSGVGQRAPLAVLAPAVGLGAAVALGRFREGGQQRTARDLGLDRFPLSGDGRLEIACMCCRHGYNHSPRPPWR